MATYPIKMMIDESGQPFVPLTSLDAVIGEKNLQYIIDATETSAGHFNIIIKDVTLDKLKNTVVVVRWPQISSTVKPSYLQLNEEEEIILYNGSGTEYLDLENASNTVNILAYDGEKWILTSGAGSGSGHIITDENGNTMEQQKVLNFVGFNVENDAVNRATKIVNPTPINNLTTTETGVGSLDAYQGHVLASRTIPSGGEPGQVLAKSNNIDYQVEWVDKDSDNVITGNGSIEEIVGVTYEEYKALEVAGELKADTEYHITDVENGTATYMTEEQIQELIDVSANDLRTQINTVQSNVTTVQNTLNGLVAQDVSEAITAYDASIVTVGNHSSLIKYGPIYVYQVSFATKTPLSANTSYMVGVISSAHCPNAANKSIQGVLRANDDVFISFWISAGVVWVYTPTVLPAGANLAGCFSWINL